MGHAAGLSMLYLEARCVSRRARGRGAGGAERLDLVRRARTLAARRHAGDPRRERARRVARSRGRLGQRRDRLALADPQDGQADGPVPARHRLRHLGLLGHAAARQHVRRRQLRRRRPRRVADDPARLAGRRAASSRSPRTSCARACASAPARAIQAVFDELGFPPVTDEEVEAATLGALERATCPTATAPPTSRPPTTAARAGRRRRSTSRSRSTAAASTDVAEAVVGMQRQRVSADYLQTSAVIEPDGLVRSAVNDPNLYLGPGHRLPPRGRALGAAAGAAARRRPARRSARRRRGAGRSSRGAAPARRGADAAEVVVAVGPAFADGAARDDRGPRSRATCSRRSSTASRGGRRRRALVRVRRAADVAFIGHDGARLSGSGVALGSSRRARR